MDLFESLVRLDAAGWTTGAPRPDRAERASTPGLGRLLRRTGTLTPPDGSPAYDFTGEPGPGWAVGLPMLRLRSGPDGETWLALHADRSSVWRVPTGGGAVILVARRLSEWLADRVQGPEPEAPPEVSRALWDLGLEGDGWGWSLAGLAVPARLDVGSLPEDLRSGPFQLDDDVVWAGDRIGVRTSTAPAPVPVPDGPAADPGVDELFGEGAGRARPRTALIASLLISGLLLTVVGMACIAAPGGILVLLAWMHVEKDVERVESGYLPAEDRPTVELSRRLTYAGLLVVVVLFAVQGVLLCNGVYDVVLDEVYLPLWQGFVRSLLDAPPPTAP